MQISDNSKESRGIFLLDIFRHGKLLEHYVDDNLIVDQGRQIVTRLLGGDGGNLQVSQIGFGVSGVAPLPGNTSLASAYLKSIDGHSYPSTTSVLFNFSLDASELNGVAIWEFGLFTASGLMHARKVRAGPLAKESDLSLSGTWQLLY